MSTQEPSFFERIWLSFWCFFRVLFDPAFAARAAQLRAAPEPAQLPGESSPRARTSASAAAVPDTAVNRPAASGAHSTGALQVLALLQREGRLIDFLQQDIQSFADADVGAAARVVHTGCRKALATLTRVTAIRSEPEGSRVTLDSSVDHGAVKLVGNVQGSGPYTGVLRHKGWRVPEIKLPELVGDQDPKVLAPAEVEL